MNEKEVVTRTEEEEEVEPVTSSEAAIEGEEKKKTRQGGCPNPVSGFVGTVSTGCKAATQRVQCFRKSRKSRREHKPSKQEKFLADIESLNRDIEIREMEQKKMAMEKGQISSMENGEGVDETETSTSYVKMEENGQPINEVPEDEKKQEPEHANFFWELIHFAKNRSWKKKVLTALIVATCWYVIIDLLFLGYIVRFINMFLLWMTLHPGGAVISFIGFFVIATLLFVPPTILYFGAGFSFSYVAGFWGGLFSGIMVCFIGCSIGAILAFLRSRYMMRDLVELFARRFPIIKCLDEAMGKRGFYLMLLMRLCPIVPFNGLNHIGGITRISMEEYTFALIGILPQIVFWVLVGASADTVGNRDTDGKGEFIFYIIMVVGGILLALLALYLVYRYAREELHNEIKAQRAVNWHSYSSNDDIVQNDRNSSRPGSTRSTEEEDPVEQGIELMEHQPGGMMAMLGIDYHGVQNGNRVPDDGRDEDILWIWA